ncbi:hypothetical protein KV697_10505 [Sphingomonas sanguinis]|uniref:hypothetical protein n=1 Tax=Sphingomonas sanguinis TaxID=33051 RepID=UPI001C5A10D0|nr:hypothetical protein [Sphingomonas sanguinis]QXT34268.1 hypothetical protein KV697_10505 [Sphingomonas sanguinis]
MRNAIVMGVVLILVGAGALFYGRQPVEQPGATSAPVLVVRRDPAIPTPIPSPPKVAPVTPVTPPADATSPMPQQRPLPDDGPPPVDMLSGPTESMRQRLAYERRKNDQAARSEAVLQTSYDRLKGIGSAGRKIDIICGLSVCQVSGSIASMPGGSMSDVMEAVQSEALMRDMAAQGYELEGSTFGPGAAGRPMFVTYYKRIAPKPSS